MLEIRLTRCGPQVIPLNTSGREILEPMLLMNSHDLLFAIGFFNLTPRPANGAGLRQPAGKRRSSW